jgi:predicted ATPase/class 3 adenylate cyclase
LESRRLPSGTVTFLFTDIEGSTRLLQRLGDLYPEVLLEHRRLLRDAFRKRQGVEVDTQGDAFFYAFPRASDAVAAAIAGQVALAGGDVRVRMGVHTGEPLLTSEGYVGIDVHRAARICSTAHGGQVVLSDATARLVDVDLHDLGEHRLKDLSAPQHLHQLGHEEFPPLRTLNFTNLPVQPTSLVGRDRECEQAGALLREHRLVTLVGPGGTGKTRLALQVAADAIEDFADGVFWVPLATIRDPELVEPAIARVVGVKDGLANHLAGRQALFVVDNFEQVLDAASRLAELLGSAPRIKLLVTSREPLRLSSEWEYLVPSMSHSEAVALFTERARKMRSDFQPDQAVAEICRRLDGLPLAIELAAARVKVLSPAQILERVGRRLDLLSGGARDLPDRQRTLRSTIDWSYELLLPMERELFARLGLFSGGWTIDAAEAICDADLETLQSVVAKSLVRQTGERFSMLQTIREYSVERLHETGQHASALNRHARFFLELAERAAPELEWGEQEAWTRRLNDEHDNLRAALEHFVRSDEPDLELRLVAAIWEFWFNQGLWQESRRAVEHALRSTSGNAPERLPVLLGAALMTWRQGDLPQGLSLAEQCVQLSRELGDTRLLGRSLRVLALNVWHEGWQRVAPLFEESVRHARDCGDLVGLSKVTSNIAIGSMDSGDYRSAADGFEQALSSARQVGDQVWSAVYLLNLSEAERRMGEFQRARTHLAECLALARRLGIRECLVDALYNVADLAATVGDYGWAAALIGTAEREADFGFVLEDRDAEQYERTLESTRRSLGQERFESALAAGRAMTLDAATDYLEKGGQSLSEPVDATEAFSMLDGLDTVQLSSFAVVGHYTRFGAAVRNALKDARENIVMGLEHPGRKRNNHLIWAAPGSGKTYFVEQIVTSLRDTAYREINLAKCDEAELRLALKEVDRPSEAACLCFIDECDAKPDEPWPYELMLPALDAAVRRQARTVFVFAGSSGSNPGEMMQRMASRPKGKDLLSRVPHPNVYSIEPMDTGDRVLVALMHLWAAAHETGRDLTDVEKMALYYVAVDERLGNARQLREFAVRAVERMRPGEERIKYDHLFSPGNPENKAFWMQWQSRHDALVNRFITVAD